MSDRIAVEASPTAEPGTVPMTFEEAVDRFCRQQAEFRAGLAQGGGNRTEPVGPETGGQGNAQG